MKIKIPECFLLAQYFSKIFQRPPPPYALGSALYVMHVYKRLTDEYKTKKIIGIKRIFITFFFYKQFACFVLLQEKYGRTGTKNHCYGFVGARTNVVKNR